MDAYPYIVCPHCTCTLVTLRDSFPVVWSCSYCGFTMMGLAVPLRVQPYIGRLMPTFDVREITGAHEPVLFL